MWNCRRISIPLMIIASFYCQVQQFHHFCSELRATVCSQLLRATVYSPLLSATISSLLLRATVSSPQLRATVHNPALRAIVDKRHHKFWSSNKIWVELLR